MNKQGGNGDAIKEAAKRPMDQAYMDRDPVDIVNERKLDYSTSEERAAGCIPSLVKELESIDPAYHQVIFASVKKIIRIGRRLKR